jgi:hypothetical protein
MSVFSDKFEDINRVYAQKNISEVRENIDSEYLKNKILNHITRCGLNYTVEDVKDLILTNAVVASFFMKNPIKQNLGEKIIKELDIDLCKLPSTGTKSVYFDKAGNIFNKKASWTTKSADYIYKDIYWTQKITKEGGGSQDNQFDDVIRFLSFGSVQRKVGAILDGDYYENGKRDELKDLFSANTNVIITSIDELISDESEY